METEIIKIEKLQEASQFTSWRFQVRVTLIASEIFDIVSGVEEKPKPAANTAAATEKTEAETKIADWRKKDARAQKIIVTALSQKMILHILNCETSNAMWKKLHAVFEQQSEVGKQHIQQKFFSFEKDPADDMATHISRMESLVHQMKDMKISVDDGMVITKILMTLPQEYRHFVSAWDSTQTDMQTISNLTNRLMIEENRLKCSGESSEAFMARKGAASTKRVNPKTKSNDKKQKGKCFKCGSTEHWKRDCTASGSSKMNKSSSGKDGGAEGGAFLGEVGALTSKDEIWLEDSGATDHMSKHRNWFRDYVELSTPREITLGNGDVIHAVGRGNIDILSFNGSKWLEKTLTNALHVPGLFANLFSKSQMLDKGHTLFSNSKEAKYYSGENIVAVGVRRGGLFHMSFKVIESSESSANMAIKKITLQMWHERLGHQSVAHVRDILRRRNIDFIDTSFDCDGCAFGKLHRLSFG